jgi:AcrR family transcriptional regulator
LFNSETPATFVTLLTTMKKKKTKQSVDKSTEQKIKDAARKVFMTKGYAASRTRDIAVEAGINLALLNYYFRSKEKLFDLIMMENVQHFIAGVKMILLNKETGLIEKTEAIAGHYIDIMTAHPDLPLFILSELRSNPEKLADRIGVKQFLFQSSYMKQLKDRAKKGNKVINPLHYFMNTLSLIIFPFIASPLIKNIADLKDEDFNKLMQERKQLVSIWIQGMLLEKP